MGFHILEDSLNDPEQQIFNTAGLLQAISALPENSPRVPFHINFIKEHKNLCNRNRDIYRDLETSV